MSKQLGASDAALAISDARASTHRKSNGCVGVFSQFFDWNRRFAKRKLFAKKLLPRASSRHDGEFFGRDDKMLRSKGLKVEEGEARKNEMKAAGLVVRLMGLENLPIGKKSEGGELKLVKASSERRKSEDSQLKSVLSSYKRHRNLHHHKLSSPKSPRLISSSKSASKASKLIDVASKILEPSSRAKPALAYDSVGKSAAKATETVKREPVMVHWKGRDQGIVRETAPLSKSESRERKSKVGNRRRQDPPSVYGKYAKNQQAKSPTKFESKADAKEAALGKYLEKKIRELGFCEDENLSFNGAMRKKSVATIVQELINALNKEQSSPSDKDPIFEDTKAEKRSPPSNSSKSGTCLKDGSFEVSKVEEKRNPPRGRLSRRQLSYNVEMEFRRPMSIIEMDPFVEALLPYIGRHDFGKNKGTLRRFAFDCVVEVYGKKYGLSSEIVPSKGDLMVKEVAEEVRQWRDNNERSNFHDVCEKWTNLEVEEEVGNQIMNMLVQEIIVEL